MGWFSFISPSGSSRELSFLRDELAFFKQRTIELEADLKTEIKRNRDREDKLINTILTSAGKFGIPIRSDIPAVETAPEVLYTTPTITPAEIAAREDERIEEVVDQLMENYHRKGLAVMREDVKQAVLMEKGEYLDD